jgi:putative phosphoribosyl transferase
VGGNDPLVLDLNRQAFRQLQIEKRLEIVPGASHLFEEPGALERVAELATEWFEDHLTTAPTVETTRTAPFAGDCETPELHRST